LQIPARRDLRIYARQPIRQEVVLRSFDRLIGMLSEIPDPRRAEGKLYQQPYILLFSILAVATGGNSYRSVETFIKVHRSRLNAAFGLNWKRAPAQTAIRYILQGLDPKSVPAVHRESAYAAGLGGATSFLHIVLPQALRNMLPALIAHIVIIFKVTSLVYLIGVIDFFRAAMLVNNRDFAPYAIYLTVALVYFCCNFALSTLIRWFDPKYKLSA
jgi:hypothetical protein